MKKKINNIYTNAIAKVFTKEALSGEGFNYLCYAEMIDESHSIVIWGNEDYDYEESESYSYREFIISIRDGAVDTTDDGLFDGLFGTKEISCYETADNSHDELHLGIQKVMNDYFGIATNE